jgi:hypothetical protein
MGETCCFAYDDGPISMETFLYDWQNSVPIDTFLYYKCFECNAMP